MNRRNAVDELGRALRDLRESLDDTDTAIWTNNGQKARASVARAQNHLNRARSAYSDLLTADKEPVNIQGTADSRPPPWSNYILEVPRR